MNPSVAGAGLCCLFTDRLERLPAHTKTLPIQGTLGRAGTRAAGPGEQNQGSRTKAADPEQQNQSRRSRAADPGQQTQDSRPRAADPG